MAEQYFGMGEESTFKTAIAAAKYMDIYDEKVVPDPGWIIPNTAARRAFDKRVLGAYRGRGSVNFPIEPENGIGWLLKWALGSITSAQQGGTVAYKHTFKCADSIKSFTGRFGVVDVATAEKILAGCMLNGISFSSAHGEELKGSVEVFNSAKETKGGIGSPTFSTLDPLVFRQATIKFATVEKAYVSKLDLSLKNAIPFDKGVLGSDTFPKIRTGKRTVDGTLNLAFDDSTEYDRFLAGTEFSFEASFVGPQIEATGYYYTLRLLLNKCQYLRDTTPHISRRELVVLNAPFQAFRDSTYTEIQVELTNKATAYADA